MSEQFADRLATALERAGVKDRGAGVWLHRLTGVTPKAASKWINGESVPRREKLAMIASKTGVRSEWLEYGVEPMLPRGESTAAAADSNAHVDSAIHRQEESLHPVEPWDSSTPLGSDELELPLFREIELSAGSGRTFVQENHGAKLRFARSTLKRKGIDPANAACCFVNGDSMEPVMPSGSTVAIDTSQKSIVDGKMYAIDHGGLLRVKYLYRLPGGGVRVRSANRDEYPDEDLVNDELKDFRIIGRVFWYAVLL